MKEKFNQEISYKNCYIIDIFDSSIITAPKAYKKRLKDVNAACEEINDTWIRF